ncbi:MAG: hypothetical protein CL612_04430 [Anaerolineaceae bacterium]|nr:hypothetical protein [Anaerolineaceae bacterium]
MNSLSFIIRSLRKLRFLFRYRKYASSIQRNGFHLIIDLAIHAGHCGMGEYVSDLITRIAFALRTDPTISDIWYRRHKDEIQLAANNIELADLEAPQVLIFLDCEQTDAIEALGITIDSLLDQSLTADSVHIQLFNSQSDEDLQRIQECIDESLFEKRTSIYPQPHEWWSGSAGTNDVLVTTAGTRFHPCAITYFAKALKARPLFVYSDHGITETPTNRLRTIIFKPDFSIDLLRCTNYIGHTFACSQQLLKSLDRSLPPTCYDLQLAAGSQPENTVHISKVLYLAPDNSHDDTFVSIKRSIQQEISRDQSRLDFTLLPATGQNSYITQYRNLNVPLSITIIIPTRDKIDLLKTCIESIERTKTDNPFEILVVDNQSSELETLHWFDAAQEKSDHIRVLRADYPFNWAKLNNHAIGNSQGDIVVLLNNDIEVISDNWLDQICGQLTRKDVGLVGGLLRYPDGSIQHAGTVTGFGGNTDHILRSLNPEVIPPDCIGNPNYQREVTAVTGAFMATTRPNLAIVGPFNEEFVVCGSDIEYCLRIRQAGMTTLFDPTIEMIHHESMSRDPRAPEADIQLLANKIHEFGVEDDPFYNRNLSKFSLYPIPDIV